MAKVKLGVLAAASGKSGGVIYSRNRGGAYLKNWVKPINPNTPAQSAARALFADLSNDWKGLTEAERATWNAATPNFKIKDRLGDMIELSGQQLYMRFNRNLQAIGAATITVAPVPTVVSTPAFGVVSVDATSFEVGYTPDPVSLNEKLIIECSTSVSAGVNFAGRSAFKQVQVVASAGVSPADIFADYNSIFGAGTLQSGAKVFIRLKIVNDRTGITSDSIQDSFIIA